MNFVSKLRGLQQNLPTMQTRSDRVVCYFQKWVVSITENNCPSIRQDFSWNWIPACPFKQNAQWMPVWESETCITVQWRLLWNWCGKCQYVGRQHVILTQSLSPLSLFFFSSIFIPPFQPATSVFDAHHFDSAGAPCTALIIDCEHTQFVHTSCCNTVAVWDAHYGVFISQEDSIRFC